MKAYIGRDVLIRIIKGHTVFSRAKDVPSGWQWYQFDGGFLTWDFVMQDKVLVEVEECGLEERIETAVQNGRDSLERMGVPGAQDFSADEMAKIAKYVTSDFLIRGSM